MPIVEMPEFPTAEDYAVLAPLERLWERLATRTGQADPFCCGPVWQISAQQAFFPARAFCFDKSDDALVLFAKYEVSPEYHMWCPLESNWLFGCPLLGEDAHCLQEILRQALSDMVDKERGFPRIVISGLQQGDALPGSLWRHYNREFIFYRHAASVQCAASLEGGLDGFLARRSANHRTKLRKAARNAARRGIFFERHTPTSMDQAYALYQRMLQVEQKSWKGRDRCGMAESPAKEFYSIMMTALARTGNARVMFARHEEDDIGFIFGAMAGKVYRGQQFSYDIEWREWSLGNLMQIHKIAWLCEEGAERYDMGPIVGPRMEYKKHWTEENREIQTWILERK